MDVLRRITERIRERFVNFIIKKDDNVREDKSVDLEAQSPLHKYKKEDNTSDEERSRRVEVLVV